VERHLLCEVCKNGGKAFGLTAVFFGGLGDGGAAAMPSQRPQFFKRGDNQAVNEDKHSISARRTGVALANKYVLWAPVKASGATARDGVLNADE